MVAELASKIAVLLIFKNFLKFVLYFWPYHAAYGVSFPDQGWNLRPQHWKHGVNLWTTREVPAVLFFFKEFLFSENHKKEDKLTTPNTSSLILLTFNKYPAQI